MLSYFCKLLSLALAGVGTVWFFFKLAILLVMTKLDGMILHRLMVSANKIKFK